MADFQHGITARLYYHTMPMAPHTESIEFALERSVAEYRPMETSVRRIAGLRDARLVLTGGALTTDYDLFAWERYVAADPAQWAFMPAGDVLGNPAYVGVSIGENQQRVAGDDVIRLPVALVSSHDVDRGEVLYPLTTVVAGGSSAHLDNGAASTDGLDAYLHCTAIDDTAPELTVAIEQAADPGGPWTTLVGTFTAITTPETQSKAVAGAVSRYLRATWTLTGTDPTATFFVAVVRH